MVVLLHEISVHKLDKTSSIYGKGEDKALVFIRCTRSDDVALQKTKEALPDDTIPLKDYIKDIKRFIGCVSILRSGHPWSITSNLNIMGTSAAGVPDVRASGIKFKADSILALRGECQGQLDITLLVELKLSKGGKK